MRHYIAELAGQEFRIEVADAGDGVYRVRIGDELYDVDAREISANFYSLIIDQQSWQVDVDPAGDETYAVQVDGKSLAVRLAGAGRTRRRERSTAAVRGECKVDSPMAGNIWKVVRREGENVQAGEVLVIVEAMKMENEIRSPVDGIIVAMRVSEGDAVAAGSPLCVVATGEG